jgi:Leucine-rich repeat (LRR) protein
MNAKRRHARDCLAFGLPLDVLCVVVQFATSTLRQTLRLKEVSLALRKAMQNPNMYRHLRAEFKSLEEVGSAIRCATVTGADSVESLARLPQLRALYLPMCKIRTDAMQAALGSLANLQELSLNSCEMLDVLTWLPSTLRVLNVSASLVSELPTLPNLEVLNVAYCRRLASLPDYPNLQDLNMSGCNLEVDMRNLRLFNASNCDRLYFLPASSTLTALDVSGCPRLTTFPDLPFLRELRMVGCPARLNASMSRLEALNSEICDLEHARNLTHVSIVHCGADDLSSISRLPNLAHLSLFFLFNSAHDLSVLELLPKLDTLNLGTQISNGDLEHVTCCRQLRRLTVSSNAVDNAGILCIATLQDLEFLRIDNWSYNLVTNLGALSALPKLREMELDECLGLRSMASLSEMRALERLSFRRCDHLANDFSTLSALSRLTELSIESCSGITSLVGISSIVPLTSLRVVWCSNLSARGWLDLLAGRDKLKLQKLVFCAWAQGHDEWPEFMTKFAEKNDSDCDVAIC